MTAPTRRHFPELELARRQHGLVTTEQLYELGLTEHAIRHRVATGRLFPVHRTVYGVGRPDLSREARWLAAVLACGPGAALCRVPAALLWEIVERGDERPRVVVATRAHVDGPAGAVVHRSETLRGREVTSRQGIPVTDVSRTLLDLALVYDARALAGAVRQAERLHRLDLVALRAQLDTPRHAVGHARLRRVLDRYVSGDAGPGLETAFLELCSKHGLPAPRTQVEIGRFRVDFLWPAERLVVETDDASHRTLVALRTDREKDRALMALGFEVLRFTYAEVRFEPRSVADEVRAHLIRRRTAGG